MLRVGDDMEVVKQKSNADPLTSYVLFVLFYQLIDTEPVIC